MPRSRQRGLAPQRRAPRGDLYSRAVRRVPPEVLSAPPCDACGATRAAARFAVEGLASPVAVCEGCGLGRFVPMPEAAVVREFYPDAYYGGPGAKFRPVIERLVRVVGARHIAFLSRGMSRGARVLDVGCGRGVILGPLADRGFAVHGFEISAGAVRGADARAEIRIAPRLAEAAYPDAFFDQIVIWHVLEHLRDPLETLREIHRILKPGGRAIVAVPNFGSMQARWAGAAWFHLDLPRHLHHFPLGALRLCLERAGFAVGRSYHFSLRQNPFGWIQSALNRFHFLPRNGLYRLLHHEDRSTPRPFAPGMRAILMASFALLAAPALAATVLEAALRSGATVHVVATRRGA